MRVGEVLLVVREAPFGENRSATRHDAGQTARRERNVTQQHTCVDGEVVNTLLRLFDQRVPIHLPGELVGSSAGLLERLIDWNRSDRYRRVSENPRAGLRD